MAEWSIAPVLKTDVLKGTGGSNPSLSARNQEQRKLLLILFYVNTGSLLTSRHIKQNRMQTPLGGCRFLAKEHQSGMGEQSEANPYSTKRRKRKAEQPPKVVADFLQRNTKQGWASKAKPIPTQIERRKQNKLLPTNPKKRNKHLQYIHKTIFIMQPL